MVSSGNMTLCLMTFDTTSLVLIDFLLICCYILTFSEGIFGMLSVSVCPGLEWYHDFNSNDFCFNHFRGRGKITLLLSARFHCLFIAIKRKRRSLHYMFNGNFIKLKYNNAYRNSNANGNYGINI